MSATLAKSIQMRRRRRADLGVAAGAAIALVVMAALYVSLLGSSVAPVGAAVVGGPFRLTQGDGQTVTDRTYLGRYVLIYFGYTSCKDVCPTTLAALASALDRLGPAADRLQALFITVDPKRDTPQRAQQFAAAFDPRLVGLSGTPDQIHDVTHAYRVSSLVHHGGVDGAVTVMDHSSVLYLLGPDGRFLAPIRPDQAGPAMAADIQRHLRS